MTPVDAIWLFLVKRLPLPATLWLPVLPSPSHPAGVLVVLTTPVKNSKMAGYQLAIHSIVCAQSINSYRIVANFMQASVLCLEIQHFK